MSADGIAINGHCGRRRSFLDNVTVYTLPLAYCPANILLAFEESLYNPLRIVPINILVLRQRMDNHHGSESRHLCS